MFNWFFREKRLPQLVDYYEQWEKVLAFSSYILGVAVTLYSIMCLVVFHNDVAEIMGYLMIAIALVLAALTIRNKALERLTKSLLDKS